MTKPVGASRDRLYRSVITIAAKSARRRPALLQRRLPRCNGAGDSNKTPGHLTNAANICHDGGVCPHWQAIARDLKCAAVTSRHLRRRVGGVT